MGLWHMWVCGTCGVGLCEFGGTCGHMWFRTQVGVAFVVPTGANVNVCSRLGILD